MQFSQQPQSLHTASFFQVAFELSNERPRFRLELRPNRNIISLQTDVQLLKLDGSSTKLATRDPPLVYKGDAFISEDESETWRKTGWARVMVRTRQGQDIIEGAFNVDGVHYHIALNSNFRMSQLSEEYVLPKLDSPHMIVWRESDTLGDRSIPQQPSANESLCVAENPNARPTFLLERSVAEVRKDSHHDAVPRQNGWFDPRDVIGETSGCPSERLVAMIGVATDCTYTAEFDSIGDARQNIISQINIASQVYEDTFNISLAIRNLTISDASCPTSSSASNRWNVPCSAGVDVSGRLSLFSEWRAQYRDENAAWTLLSTCASGSTVGMAWVGNICSSGSRSWGGRRSVASTNIVVRTNAEWQVMAHELAHNFGASHDCTSDTCNGNSPAENCCPLSRSSCDSAGQYLMNPSSGRRLESFSPCTIGSICTAIGRGLIDTSCLVTEADAPDINDSQCGNGIVEPGESCDCGGEEGCPENSCCNPNTCQLRSGAECDPASDGCCTDECQIAESGQVCRASTGAGDPQETCDGSSSQCPQDERNTSGDDNGDRRGGDSGGSGGSWLDNNRTLIIALPASIGGVIFALVAICIISSCVKRRKKAGTRLQRRDARHPNLADVGSRQVLNPPQMVYRYA